MLLIRLFTYLSSTENRWVASGCGLWGWLCSLFLIDVSSFTFEFLVKGFIAICMSSCSILAGLFAKDIYNTYLKKIIFKTDKEKPHSKNTV